MSTILRHRVGRVTLVVRSEYDPDPDLSWLGEPCSYKEARQWSPNEAFYSVEIDAIKLPRSDHWRNRKGQIVQDPESLDYYETRYHRGRQEFLKLAADTRILRHLFQDADRLRGLWRGDWAFIGIVASVLIDYREVGSAAVWGFESDMPASELRREARRIALEAITDAKKHKH